MAKDRVDQVGLGPSLPPPGKPQTKTVKMTFESEEAAQKFLKERAATRSAVDKNTKLTIKAATQEQTAALKQTAQAKPAAPVAKATAPTETPAAAAPVALTEKIELPAASIKVVDQKVLARALSKMGGGQEMIASMRSPEGQALLSQAVDVLGLGEHADEFTLMALIISLARQNRDANSALSSLANMSKQMSNRASKDAEGISFIGKQVEALFGQVNLRLEMQKQLDPAKTFMDGKGLVDRYYNTLHKAERELNQRHQNDARTCMDRWRPTPPPSAATTRALENELREAMRSGNTNAITRARENLAAVAGGERAWTLQRDLTPAERTRERGIADAALRDGNASYATASSDLTRLQQEAVEMEARHMAYGPGNLSGGARGTFANARSTGGLRDAAARSRNPAAAEQRVLEERREAVTRVQRDLERQKRDAQSRGDTAAVARLSTQIDGVVAEVSSLTEQIRVATDASIRIAGRGDPRPEPGAIGRDATRYGATIDGIEEAFNRGRISEEEAIQLTNEVSTAYATYSSARDSDRPNAAARRRTFEDAVVRIESRLARARVADQLTGSDPAARTRAEAYVAAAEARARSNADEQVAQVEVDIATEHLDRAARVVFRLDNEADELRNERNLQPPPDAARVSAIDARLAAISAERAAAGATEQAAHAALTSARAHHATTVRASAAAQDFVLATQRTPPPSASHVQALRQANETVRTQGAALDQAHATLATKQSAVRGLEERVSRLPAGSPERATAEAALTRARGELASARTAAAMAGAQYASARGVYARACHDIETATWPAGGADYVAHARENQEAEAAFFALPPLTDAAGAPLYAADVVRPPTPSALATDYARTLPGALPTDVPHAAMFNSAREVELVWLALPAPRPPVGEPASAAPPAALTPTQAHYNRAIAAATAAGVTAPPTMARAQEQLVPGVGRDRAAAFVTGMETIRALERDAEILARSARVDQEYMRLPAAIRPAHPGDALAAPTGTPSAEEAEARLRYNNAVTAATAPIPGTPAGPAGPRNAAAAHAFLYGLNGHSTVPEAARAYASGAARATLNAESHLPAIRRAQLMHGHGVASATAERVVAAEARERAALAAVGAPEPSLLELSPPAPGDDSPRARALRELHDAREEALQARFAAHRGSTHTPATPAEVQAFTAALRNARGEVETALTAVASADAAVLAAERAVASAPAAPSPTRARAETELTAARRRATDARRALYAKEQAFAQAHEQTNAAMPAPRRTYTPGVEPGVSYGSGARVRHYASVALEVGLSFGAAYGAPVADALGDALRNASKYMYDGMHSIRMQAFAHCDEAIERTHAALARSGMRDSSDWMRKMEALKRLVQAAIR